MSQFRDNSIFWIEVDRIKPNPFQPRREFDEDKLNDLAESIKQYGLLQPLTVTRKEVQRDDGSLFTEYELIAGERRLRASKIAGLTQIPAIIRSSEDSDRVKLELAIIENLQREDLNPIERAEAFRQLSEDFGFKHAEIAKRVGKSREYVSNTLRLLALPDDIKSALSGGKITEGHARPMLMLSDRPEEQQTLFKEVLYKKLTVREAESIARRVAFEKVRKQSRSFDPGLVEVEEKLAESLGTRVFIEKRQVGGKIMIDFFSDDDLQKILALINRGNDGLGPSPNMLKDFIEKTNSVKEVQEVKETGPTVKEAVADLAGLDHNLVQGEDPTQEKKPGEIVDQEEGSEEIVSSNENLNQEEKTEETISVGEQEKMDKEEIELLDDSSPDDEKQDLYSLENFSV